MCNFWLLLLLRLLLLLLLLLLLRLLLQYCYCYCFTNTVTVIAIATVTVITTFVNAIVDCCCSTWWSVATELNTGGRNALKSYTGEKSLSTHMNARLNFDCLSARDKVKIICHHTLMSL
jgi:hypothetical protein